MTTGPQNTVAVRRFAHDMSAAICASAETPLPEGDEQTVMTGVIDGVRYTLTRRAQDSHERVELSAREGEIARLVAHGYANKTVAAVLGISSWTVDTYLRRIYSKLGVRSRCAMVTRLTREGILDARDPTPEWAEAWQAATNRHGDSGLSTEAQRGGARHAR